ncbi:MAG: MASE1 domain-containing protein [Rhodomicrobium sp.]
MTIAARVLELAVIAAICLMLAKLGLKLALINPSASPVWPATGFALAMILLRGHHIWPAVFIAALIANAITAGSFLTSAIIASGDTVEALIGGYLITWFCRGTRAFDTPKDVAKFALICIGPPTLISATIGVSALQAGGFIEPGQLTSVWMTWWMGDCASALLLTPVIVLWAVSGPGSYDRRALANIALLVAAASAIGFVVFTPLAGAEPGKAPMGFLVMMPLIWAGLYRGQRDTATVALVLACFAIWGAAGITPSVRFIVNDAVMLVSMFVIGAALPSLALSAEVASRRQAQEKLCESEERLRNLGNSLPESAIYQYAEESNGTLRFRYISAGIEQLLGLRVEDVLRDAGALFGRILPEYLPRLFEEKRRSASKLSDFKMEVPMRRIDGEVRWMRLRSRPHRRQDGAVIWDGVQTDITEPKQHLEQINLLLREVNHRSKNMLAIVQAIARQTAAANPNDFIERFAERIQALASSQDLLVQSEWRGVDLDLLVRSQLGPFKNLVNKRIALRGPSLLISASAAQVLGMALHELTTNAGKYGALSNGGGHVDVGWSLEPGESGAEIFVISCRERGGPAVTPPARSGYGSTVLCKVAKESLDAKVELNYASTGLVWRLQCAARRVIDTGSSA